MSTLFVDTINEKTTNNGVEIPGHVLQIQQTVFKDTFSTSIGPNFAEITGLRCDITPKSTSSKILIRFSLCIASQYWQVRGRILKDGSPLDGALGNQRGSNRTRVSYNYTRYGGGSATSIYDMSGYPVEYLDSPSTTSAVQYSIDGNRFVDIQFHGSTTVQFEHDLAKRDIVRVLEPVHHFDNKENYLI